ncbi:transposase [Streptomyces litchfieldiae]|uniref:Transposase n=1 Tax=Streptomyces litchfieldiae TaxID=3075543 RepID=A0ABU2MQL1_9ACTN|nr:transposase [Streptomyces sp. DSM 44938]MDT0343692.1 transposase [Streptomyces sp. DSM 44938]
MRTPQENLRHGHARAEGRTLPGQPDGHLVRIIDYTVTVRSARTGPRIESFRLVTSLLDHHQAPARQLAQIYHERWEIENGYAELKNRLRGAGFVLRSQTPDLVWQEIYALLTVYQAICALEARTAQDAGIDADRLSFSVSVHITRLTVVRQAGRDEATLEACRHEVTAELLAALLPSRRNRRCDRAKKPIKNTFEVKKRGTRYTEANVRYTLTITKHPPPPAQTR